MSIQTILTVAVVLAAVAFLIWKIKAKSGSCGGGCGCSSTDKKETEKK